jgi:hypothetical protein
MKDVNMTKRDFLSNFISCMVATYKGISCTPDTILKTFANLASLSLFKKILVMPNMDDVWLTIMHSAMDPRTFGGPLAPPAADPPPCLLSPPTEPPTSIEEV